MVIGPAGTEGVASRPVATAAPGYLVLGRGENMMGRLAKVLKAIARFVNRAVIDVADDRPGGGMAARRGWEEDTPPDWERKDLGI